jgi:hypothetical protein
MDFDTKIKKNPKAYIDFLQAQNRARKLNQLADKEQIINKQKEEAFNIYLQGANQERVEDQRQREKRSKLREKSLGVNVRKKWSEEKPRPAIKPKTGYAHPDAFPVSHMSSRSESLQVFSKTPKYPTQKEQIITYLRLFDDSELKSVINFLNTLVLPTES